MNHENRRPLDGIRVLDVGTFIAAPFAATLMAEFGAEVIKIELPNVGDHARRLGTPTECGDTLIWLSEARNKKSVTLDLRKPEGARLFKELVRQADVVCENFQVGTLEGWGLGWEDLRAVNPKLVMLRISGYGQTGPYSRRPCFGRIANAFGGISYLAGDPDGPPATPGSATLSDYLAGLFGAFATVMALRDRDGGGDGQMIDVGLYEGIFRFLDELAPAYAKFGFVRERMGADTPIVVPHSHYPTQDGRWIAIACTNDRIFGRLASAMRQPELADPGDLGTLRARLDQRDRVNKIVADWTLTLSRDEALTACAEAEVPCGPVYAVDEIFQDEQYRARENMLELDDPRAGQVVVPNVVPRMSATPGRVDWLGPALGAHTQEIFGRLLDMAPGDLEKLRKEGVV